MLLTADKSYGYHTVLDEEQAAFADWINDTLSDDQVLIIVIQQHLTCIILIVHNIIIFQ